MVLTSIVISISIIYKWLRILLLLNIMKNFY